MRIQKGNFGAGTLVGGGSGGVMREATLNGVLSRFNGEDGSVQLLETGPLTVSRSRVIRGFEDAGVAQG